MKHRMTWVFAVCLIALAFPGAAEFKSAAAMRVVTPEPLLPVSGGVGTPNPATRKLGDLAVRTLVMEQSGTYVAIVSGDFLGFPGSLCKKVRDQVRGIPPENILIGSTHAHSAPDMYGFVNEKGETAADPKYADWVCGQMAEAINEAMANLEPAKVKINTGEAKGKIAYNYYAPQLYDPRMSVIQTFAPDGKPIATLINYASHPEIIGPNQGILSPDFVGPLADRVKELGGGMGIYMNSAQGGMVTADCRAPDGKNDIRTWDECVRIGNLMAEEALRIVAGAPVQDNPALVCKATTIKFPVESPILKQVLETALFRGGAELDGKLSAQLNVVNLGNAQILTIPGEALPNIGYYLKRKMHGKHNLLFGLTNDAFGYMLTKVDWHSFKRYEYISETCLGEYTGEILIEEALKFIDQCPQPAAN